jgi:hypothetical protein
LLFVCFRLYINWRFLSGVEEQLEALKRGLNEVLPLYLLRPFDENELDVCNIKSSTV